MCWGFVFFICNVYMLEDLGIFEEIVNFVLLNDFCDIYFLSQ